MLGGVKVNLTNDKEIKDAFKTIVKNAKNYDGKAEIKRRFNRRDGQGWQGIDHWFKT